MPSQQPQQSQASRTPARRRQRSTRLVVAVALLAVAALGRQTGVMFEVAPSGWSIGLFGIGWLCGWLLLCCPRTMTTSVGPRAAVPAQHRLEERVVRRIREHCGVDEGVVGKGAAAGRVEPEDQGVGGVPARGRGAELDEQVTSAERALNDAVAQRDRDRVADDPLLASACANCGAVTRV